MLSTESAFFLECNHILEDLWLPLSPWSLYNSNCVQICTSSTCHFPTNNLLYACCERESLTVTANPSLFTPHIQFHICLCICTLLKPGDSWTDSMWQLNISSTCIWGCKWIRSWQKCIWHMMYFEVPECFFFPSPRQTHWECL